MKIQSCSPTTLLKRYFKTGAFLWILQDTSRQTYVLMKMSWRRLTASSSEDVCKTSSRRLDQDDYIRLSLTSSEDVFKTSWSRPIYSSWRYVFKTSSRCLGQDQYICLGHTYSWRLQDVFETSSRRFQDVFRTSSRCFQDVFNKSSRRLQDFFKTVCSTPI